MNPYFQQQQPHAPQAQPQQYAQNFQQMQQSYRLPAPYQATAGWPPQPFVMPRYQYPFHMGQVPLQVPAQQPTSSQASSELVGQSATQSTTIAAPPLPASEPPPEPAPLPPPPDNMTFKPAPPPPDEEPSYKNRTQASNFQDGISTQTDFSNVISSNEQKADVNYKTAISSLAVSTHSESSNEDLEVLQNQQKELENQMKKYQSEYEKWFKEFSLWKKQHESHPDQRKYIEYQQKYQKLIEQQQQALKQKYLELQNRIKKKKENETGTQGVRHQLQPNLEYRQREELPQNPAVSHVISQPYSMISSYASMNDSKVIDHSGHLAKAENQPVHSAYQHQISPFQGSRKTSDIQSSYTVDRPNQDQGFHPWQKQGTQELPISHGNVSQSSNIHPTSQSQYQEPSSQQSNIPHYQLMSQEKSNVRHQESSFLQSHTQPSLFPKYQDSSKQEKEMLYANSINPQQTLLCQTPSSLPNASSQSLHMNTQIDVQSQNLYTKSQGYQLHQGFHDPPQSYSHHKLQGSDPAHAPSSKYQSYHNTPQKLQDSNPIPSLSSKYQSFHNPPQNYSHSQKLADNDTSTSLSSKYQDFHSAPQSYSHNQKPVDHTPSLSPASKHQSFHNPPQSYAHQKLTDPESGPSPSSRYQSHHNPPQSYSHNQNLADHKSGPSPSSRYQSHHNPPKSYFHNQKLADHDSGPSPSSRYQSHHDPSQSYSHDQKLADHESGPSPSSRYQSHHNPPQSYLHNQKLADHKLSPYPASKYQDFHNAPLSYSQNQKLADHDPSPSPSAKYQDFHNAPQSYSYNQKLADIEPSPSSSSKYQSFSNPPQNYLHSQKLQSHEPTSPAAKHQSHQHPPQNLYSQKLQSLEPPPSASRYQGPHNPTHLSKKSDVNMADHRFQNTLQHSSTHGQQMKPNNKSVVQHKESRIQQQTFHSQQRMPSNVDRYETQLHQSNVAKYAQSMNNQRMPKPEMLQSKQNVRSKPIPSLMSQQIIKRDHYDAQLDFVEEEDLNAEEEVNSTMQGSLLAKSAHSRTEESLPEESQGKLKGNQLPSGSMTGEDFASDDVTAVDDWESETGIQMPPPSPQRSKQRQNQPYSKADSTSPKPIWHSTETAEDDVEEPKQNMQPQPPQVKVQPRPGVNHPRPLRPLMNTSSPSLMTPRFGSKQQEASINEKMLAKPGISSVPPVEPPSTLLKDAAAIRQVGNAPTGQNSLPKFSPRTPGAGLRMPIPSLNSGSGAFGEGMNRSNERKDTVSSKASDRKRLPSLTHQYYMQSKIPGLKNVDCRHFPNCRFKASCHNRHPPCSDTVYCEDVNCIYDHPKLSRQEVNDIKMQKRNQKTEVQPSQDVNVGMNRDRPGTQPHSILPRSGEGFQQRERLGDYGSIPESKSNIFSRNQNMLPQGRRYPTDRPDFHGERGKDFSQDARDENYYSYKDFESIYNKDFGVSKDRPPPQDLPGARFGHELEESTSGDPSFGFQGNKSGHEGLLAGGNIDGKNKAVNQSNKNILEGTGKVESTYVEKKGGPKEGSVVADSKPIERAQGEGIDQGKPKPAVEKQAEVKPDTNLGQPKESYLEEMPRHPDNDYRMHEQDRGAYWNPDEDWYQDNNHNQFYDRERDWPHMQAQNRGHEGLVYQGRGSLEVQEGFDHRDAYHAMPARDEWGRLPERHDVARRYSREDAGGHPMRGDTSSHDERDYQFRDYPARAPLRDNQLPFREYNRPTSPPRRESFREQIDFERRYRDWEKQHFPIDDPTREWEFEVRRRELLDREGYGQPFDAHHRSEPFYQRDPFLERPRDTFRPAVFDYDHARKFEVYDYEAPLRRSPSQASGMSSGKDVLDRSNSSDRRKASPSIRSRSPRPSHSPRRGSSPRRGDQDRSSRNLQRRSRSRSSSRKSASPSRRSTSRRSPSPKRRRSSPSRNRRHSREDSRSRDRSDRKDRLTEGDRRRIEPSRSSGRIPPDRQPRGEAYYNRYPETVVPEAAPPEPGPEILPIQDLLDPPGRKSRPSQIVIVLRGPPGCGKTHIAKIIKDKEVSNKAPAPRILALDDYFIQESDVYEKDPDTGKRMKAKKLEYVYEEEMEDAYRVSLLKSFNKTLDNGYFPLIIIDAINDKVEHFQKFWSDGKHKGFEVYIAEMHGEAQDCAEKNIHNWTQEKIQKILDNWESTPNHFKQLDVSSLVQDAAIEEVEMEEVEQPVVEKQPEKEATKDDDEDVDEEDLGTFHIPQKSKWEETKDEQLAKLDGISHSKSKKRKPDDMFRNDDDADYYDDDPYDEREEDMRIGKKRVRWADIEEKKQLEHRKRIGFCIGTDWSVLTDPNAQVPL